MKKMIYVLAFAIVFLVGACNFKKTENTYFGGDGSAIQDNFYRAINKEWLNGNWVSSGSPLYNEFTRIQIEVDEQLKTDFEKMSLDFTDILTEDQMEFIKLYRKGVDFAVRRADGTASVQAILEEMTVIDSFATLVATSKEWLLKDYQLPYEVEVIANPLDMSKKMLMLSAPQTILPDKTYYEDGNKKSYLLGVYRMLASHVLVQYSYKKEEAEQLVDGAIAFDAQLTPFLSANEELYSAWNFAKENGLKSFSEVKDYSAVLSLGEQLSGLIGIQPQMVYVTNPVYFEQLDTIVQEENFTLYKAWALVSQMMELAPYMTGEIMQTVSQFAAELRGQSSALPNEYVTYSDVTGVFKETLSIYYGQRYADDAAIKAVQDMTRSMIETYKERILESDWLSNRTKQAAVKKLDSLTYHIGYQANVSERAKSIKVDELRSYAENMLAIKLKDRTLSFACYNDSFDRSSWDDTISASDVTAVYIPHQNAIYIPAAILQAPYYDKSQSLEQNYGGIGKIIGHEITHALDSVGANFDETGSLKNWWTDTDRQRFNEKTKAIIKQFDGLEYYGGTVDGQLTLAENIADFEGILLALETLKKEDETADLRVFFEHYAMSRRESVLPSYGDYMLVTEVHAPEELRVNISLQQIEDFHQIYTIQKGDPMYRTPKERVVIW